MGCRGLATTNAASSLSPPRGATSLEIGTHGPRARPLWITCLFLCRPTKDRLHAYRHTGGAAGAWRVNQLHPHVARPRVQCKLIVDQVCDARRMTMARHSQLLCGRGRALTVKTGLVVSRYLPRQKRSSSDTSTTLSINTGDGES